MEVEISDFCGSESLAYMNQGGTMIDQLSEEDLRRIKEGIRIRYSKVALTPEGTFRYPTGRAVLEGLRYDPQVIDTLLQEVLSFYAGPDP
jgi:hypothetical protein